MKIRLRHGDHSRLSSEQEVVSPRDGWRSMLARQTGEAKKVHLPRGGWRPGKASGTRICKAPKLPFPFGNMRACGQVTLPESTVLLQKSPCSACSSSSRSNTTTIVPRSVAVQDQHNFCNPQFCVWNQAIGSEQPMNGHLRVSCLLSAPNCWDWGL